jgi:ribonuclease VapC
MVLDTSAVIAAITNEQDSSRFRAAMLGAESLLISSVAVLETKIVLFARGYNPDFDR